MSTSLGTACISITYTCADTTTSCLSRQQTTPTSTANLRLSTLHRSSCVCVCSTTYLLCSALLLLCSCSALHTTPAGQTFLPCHQLRSSVLQPQYVYTRTAPYRTAPHRHHTALLTRAVALSSGPPKLLRPEGIGQSSASTTWQKYNSGTPSPDLIKPSSPRPPVTSHRILRLRRSGACFRSGTLSCRKSL